ncbi:(d)CMP kinase [Candidatus Woesearchaeota archaeon]|nr:(d)CMP kinase [Candidatus Woesearchaeota archaeon]
MIITISGTPGSGKSTVAKILVEKLKAERIYVGGIRREIARKKGWTLEELNKYAQTHPETDVDVDKDVTVQARQLEKAGKKVIVEGRTQYHFLPESIKIYIKVEPEEGARRIWNDLQEKELRDQRNEGNIASFEQMKLRMKQRQQEDIKRYQKYYSINPYDESHYDLVVDSTAISAEEVAEKILSYVKKYLRKQEANKSQNKNL